MSAAGEASGLSERLGMLLCKPARQSTTEHTMSPEITGDRSPEAIEPFFAD